MHSVEILAPAGDLEALKIAVWHGADAVYLAAQDFGMRSAPANFTFEQLKEGVEFAHANGCKVYQTVNVLPTNSEADNLEEFILKSAHTGIDAIIVADIGVLMLSKRVAPELDVHISVQMGVMNWLTALELYNLGASRVVLARELTISQIAEIRSKVPEDLEIEAFVHGAICMSISGRCLISKYFVDRDANHGECAQPCRWEYDITDPRDETRKLNVVENMVKDKNGNIVSTGSYILNSKDLCLIEHIPELVRAGVYSLKIEGRAKSSFYVASVVQAYRRAVDYYVQNTQNTANTAKLPSSIIEDVQKISHREYTTGFYFAETFDENGEVTADEGYDLANSPGSCFEKGYKQEWQPIAVKLEDGWHQRGKIRVGETVEFLLPVKSSKYDNLISSTGLVCVKSIYALDNDKSRKIGRLLPEPQPLEATSHADQLLDFEFEIIKGSDECGNDNLNTSPMKFDESTTLLDANNLPFGTFLRAKI